MSEDSPVRCGSIDGVLVHDRRCAVLFAHVGFEASFREVAQRCATDPAFHNTDMLTGSETLERYLPTTLKWFPVLLEQTKIQLFVPSKVLFLHECRQSMLGSTLLCKKLIRRGCLLRNVFPPKLHIHLPKLLHKAYTSRPSSTTSSEIDAKWSGICRKDMCPGVSNLSTLSSRLLHLCGRRRSYRVLHLLQNGMGCPCDK